MQALLCLECGAAVLLSVEVSSLTWRGSSSGRASDRMLSAAWTLAKHKSQGRERINRRLHVMRQTLQQPEIMHGPQSLALTNMFWSFANPACYCLRQLAHRVPWSSRHAKPGNWLMCQLMNIIFCPCRYFSRAEWFGAHWSVHQHLVNGQTNDKSENSRGGYTQEHWVSSRNFMIYAGPSHQSL